ncbi:hypothetical protein HAZELMIKA_58 [Klebsiella phage vB_KaeD_HazelMika]|nr:hypothetical protein HAZELMIKA_58 [Klebsiella phage vB_KaeD_HazelMika]
MLPLFRYLRRGICIPTSRRPNGSAISYAHSFRKMYTYLP